MTDGDAAAALVNFAPYIQDETLTLSLEPGELVDAEFRQTISVGDEPVTLSLKKVG